MRGLLEVTIKPLNADCGPPTRPAVAVIDEGQCIGCALCLPACPVDAILGAPKHLHTVIAAYCTGCELCLPPCPVDCIELVPLADGDTEDDIVRRSVADAARERHRLHLARLHRQEPAASPAMAPSGHAIDPEAGCGASSDRTRPGQGCRCGASAAPRASGLAAPVNAARRAEIFARLQAANEHPSTELTYATPFELLVAVILSAQATDKSVNLATAELFPVARTPESLIALGADELERHVKRIGLYRTKVKHILDTCRALLERHGGAVPDNREALEKLPGVGRKTANVILNTAFGQPTIAVDTHIFRVANRTGLAPGKTVREVEDRLVRLTPPQFRRDAHHWLILHGRYVCKARKPECATCPIGDLCEYPHKTGTGAA